VVLIAIALAIAFLIKTFLFQAFYIPSPSMEPTLNVGDRVLVNKLSYDLHDVNRGDIVVFEAPEAEAEDGMRDLVKRVVGLPGEEVEYRNGLVYVDGEPLEEEYLPDGTTTAPPAQACPRDTGASITVPAESYVVLGDNRGASRDSRCFGPIPEDDIVGRVWLRFWPPTRIGFP
jgi:signal peptidase I